MREAGGFSPITQSAMDWALEELLQDETMIIKNDDRTTDYIDQLHEMLNEEQQQDCLVVPHLLPPPHGTYYRFQFTSCFVGPR